MLELVDFSLRFEDVILFEKVNLLVKENEQICLKTAVLDGGTSLLKCFAGIYPASSGKVLFQGQEVYLLSGQQKFSSVSYCYELGGLISTFSNYDNIALPLLYNDILSKHKIAERVGELAEALQISAIMHKEPHQLNDVQTRLMNLLRGLCIRPKLLLIDEIQAGMSDEMVDDTLAVIKQQQAAFGFSLIMTTTAGDITDFSDRTLTIENRQIVG